MRVIWFTIYIVAIVQQSYCQEIGEYLNVVVNQGKDPLVFVKDKLNDHNLIIFDDALHLAYEPFVFYEELLSSDTSIDYVFIETFSIASQPHLDAYLESDKPDSTLLFPVFQNTFSGTGWSYTTYLNLLKHIRYLNKQRGFKIRVIGVDQPIYWEAIHTREDYDIFNQSLTGRDYFMYKVMLKYMDNFSSSKKGIFLTNTRHAYKNIRTKNNTPFWNCGTFFYHWNSGNTFSIRFHNVSLFIEAQKSESANESIEGLDQIVYRWGRMEEGKWDEAFRENDNKPVAIPLKDNVFGNTPYVGNHMLHAKKGQIMYDAYDGLIFLVPLNELHFSPKMGFFYTESFKKELRRRIQIINEGNMESFLERNGVSTLDDFIEQISSGRGVIRNNLLD